MWAWLIDPGNGPLISAIGIVLTVLGFPLTLVGLYWTYNQAKAATHAAAAAELAVKNFKMQIVRYDASKDLAFAMAALKNTLRHLDNESWETVVGSYDEAREAFIRILKNVSDLDEATLNNLSTISEQIRRFCDKVDRASGGKDSYPDKNKAKSAIRKNYSLVIDIQKYLYQGI